MTSVTALAELAT